MRIERGAFQLHGRSLSVHSLRVNGPDQLEEFVRGQGYPSPQDPSRARFLERLVGKLRTVADEGEAASDTIFRSLRMWPDQWELRVSEGRANHRLHGFVTPDRRLLIVAYTDKRAEKPDARVLRLVAAVREQWLTEGDQW